MLLWCDEQILVHIEGPDGERDIVVPQPMARIGAHPLSEIALTGPGIAKRVLYLHATADGIYALNLDLEDANLDERGRWITPEKPLLVGLYRLTIRTASGRVAAPGQVDLAASQSASLPIPAIRVFTGNVLKDRRRFRSELSIIGRRPQCSLQLRGLKVSSFHCALYWHERRLWCIDLLSSNGTRLNGEPLDCGEVRLNDRLDIGEFGLVYYRLSPHRAMAQSPEAPPKIHTPAPEAGTAPEAGINEAGPLPPAAESPLPVAVPEVPGALAQWEAEREQLRNEWAAETARLNREHQTLQQLWSEESQQLAAQLSEMLAEVKRLVAERPALEAARQEWQHQCNDLAEQLAAQSLQIFRLEADLALAKTELALRSNKALQTLPAAAEGNLASKSAISLDHELPLPETGSLALPQGENPAPSELPADPWKSMGDSDDRESAPVRTLTGTVIEGLVRPAADGQEVPQGRMKDREELTKLVSSRLLDMERENRGRAAVVWGAVGITALVLAALALGIWGWMS